MSGRRFFGWVLEGAGYDVEVEVEGPNRDLHSGLYGGAVPNPINVLSKMIGELIDENGHITIDGFYDNVLIVSDSDRAEMNKLKDDPENKMARSVWKWTP